MGAVFAENSDFVAGKEDGAGNLPRLPRAGRELRRRDFAAAQVRWPQYQVRADFARLAERLRRHTWAGRLSP
ncbi:hypothetical protein GCM10010298_26540 [Streptomyces microflavus]|uniref:Uncharacterized protein n=1 Tax=Streptomyces microflavus TaxID=1919 RepID=A0A7J0CXN4_STRMI|nr:hypothetical protein Smic_57040 [Streptomyces microflavus]GGX60710.1 hypothetical protein GCM10010298_26540 [Streptomyces microflavus]